jgi:hypothetical protein
MAAALLDRYGAGRIRVLSAGSEPADAINPVAVEALREVGIDLANVERLSKLFGDSVGRGDVILSTQPEQVPVLAYYFGYDKQFATPLGPVADNRVMDWRDSLEELRAARPATTLEPILDRLEPGGRIFLVRPVIRDNAAWSAAWTSLVRERSQEWSLALIVDERFTRTRNYVPQYTDRFQRALLVEIFEKTSSG